MDHDNDIKSTPSENPLAALLADKELLAHLSEIAKTLKTDTAPSAQTDASTPSQDATAENKPQRNDAAASIEDPLSLALSSPELMAKLPDVMTALTPILKGENTKKAPPDRRTALLLALRPYLSPGRCEAIDYITRIGKLGDVVKNLKL